MAYVNEKLIQYFVEHPGIHIAIEDLSTEMGVERRTCFNSLAVILKDNKLPGLKKLTKAGPYIYQPNSKKTDSIYFELIKTTKKGELLIESEDGTLYKAVEI